MKLPQIYRRVLQLLGADTRTAWLLVCGNVALVVALFAEPVLFGLIIDVLTRVGQQAKQQAWSEAWPFLLLWISFGLFTIVSGALIALFADRLAHRRRHEVIKNYFEHVLQLPMTMHTSVHSGRLMKIMLNGTDALWGVWLSFFRESLAALVALIVLIPTALYINWRLAILLILLCVMFAVMTNFILRKTFLLQSQVEGHHSDLAEHTSDTLGNVALVQSFARVEQEVGTLRQISSRLLGAQYPVLSWWAIVTVMTRSATTLTILSIIIAGTWLYVRDLISIGEIVTFIAFAGMVISRLEQTVSFMNRLAMDAPKLLDFFQILDTTPTITDQQHSVDAGRLLGKIEFDRVDFSYDGHRPALSQISFVAEPGQTIALVGASGAGKSTSMAMLYRAFDPQAGVVRIDGVDVRAFTLNSLRRNIGVVFQEPLLFNRSIADNLKVGLPEATEADLRDAAKRAQALDFIESHPAGFEAKVGERGRALSGGERQRLSIARVLLKNPPILILDEATSALDSETESKLLLALDEVTRNRTTFVIAHRLSTIRQADQILVFDNGHIVETGTFETLYALGGCFTRIANEQFSAFARMSVETPLEGKREQ